MRRINAAILHISCSAMLFLTVLPQAARAAAIVPGDACTTVNQTTISSGTDTSGIHYLLKCTGSKWVQVMKVDAAGNVSTPGALQPGYDASTCSTALTGEIRYDSTSPAYTYCNGSAWTPFKSAGCPVAFGQFNAGDGSDDFINGLATDGTYYYAGINPSSVRSYVINGYTITPKNTVALANTSTGITDIYTDGTYIYVAQGTAGIFAYTYNGTSFTLKGSYTTSMNAQRLFKQGSNIFVADGSNGVKAFTFSGSAFTLKGTYSANSPSDGDVTGDGTYIYIADQNNGVRALTFSGTTWTLKGTSTAVYPGVVTASGGYIFASTGYYNTIKIVALTFNGSAFATSGSITVGNNVGAGTDRVIYQSPNLFVSINGEMVGEFGWSGSVFTLKSIYTLNGGGGLVSSAVATGYLYMMSGFAGLEAYASCP